MKKSLRALLQWRHSLFWTIVPAMFLTSSATWLTMDFIATVSEDSRLRASLAPAQLRPALEQALRATMPLLESKKLTSPGCVDVLELLAERAMTPPMGDRTGDTNPNGFLRAAQTGRFVITMRTADGSTCQFAADQVLPALQQQMRAPGDGGIIEQPDGWLSITVVRAREPGMPELKVGVHILSPWAKLKEPRQFRIPLALFILSLNLAVALVLLALLIRRIERANRAAYAWTHGDLTTRINDQGKDELSRLTQQFDTMADAMAGVIEVKQALAAAEERNRLARDLHDTAKQRAFALNLQLTALREMHRPDAASAKLVDASLSLTYQLQQDLTGIIRRLAAPTIAESGFRHVLTEGIEAFLAGSQIAWSITLSEAFEAALDPAPEVSRQLFLISMEAVANVLKHAKGCMQCTLEGEQRGAVYTWRITDNGEGVLPAALGAQGMGLANMKLRADGLNQGSLDIATGLAGGTIISVTFEL
ncbi:sensor histidine kinase [Duganella sp. PWIR1]